MGRGLREGGDSYMVLASLTALSQSLSVVFWNFLMFKKTYDILDIFEIIA